MIYKASSSGIMETDMKASGKMTNNMGKVRKKLFTLWFINSNIVW